MQIRQIKLTPGCRTQVFQDLNADKKINAIKAFRVETGLPLHEARDLAAMMNGDRRAEDVGIALGSRFRVKKFLLECDDGDIEVDMEGLKLRFLMEMPEIGIDGVTELLELVNFTQKWQCDA